MDHIIRFGAVGHYLVDADLGGLGKRDISAILPIHAVPRFFIDGSTTNCASPANAGASNEFFKSQKQALSRRKSTIKKYHEMLAMQA